MVSYEVRDVETAEEEFLDPIRDSKKPFAHRLHVD